ncbi:MAG: zinc ABC transporter substrate-binding protein [Clostridia bacterium]|nr:zinc ABC transporter substrate-binding protein [Clostridia bacterium]
MKKIISVITVLCLILVFFAGCGDAENNNAKFKIVTTSFSAYDWTSNILGEKADNYSLELLSNNGVDMHSYQPTTDDIIKISECDILVYVGGESDSWVKKVLKTATNKNMQIINMLETVGDAALKEEVVEGMTDDEHEGHNHENEQEKADEHIWLSLRNAITVCEKIANAVSKVDSLNTDYYNENTENYKNKLKTLDSKYSEILKDKSKALIFADRFPFRYLTEDYGLKYYACFPGCSAETDASFDSVIFLSDKIDELNIGSVFVIEGSDKKIAQTVINNTKNKNQRVLSLDSMQAVTMESIEKGLSYISVMEKNLNNIKISLD